MDLITFLPPNAGPRRLARVVPCRFLLVAGERENLRLIFAAVLTPGLALSTVPDTKAATSRHDVFEPEFPFWSPDCEIVYSKTPPQVYCFIPCTVRIPRRFQVYVFLG